MARPRQKTRLIQRLAGGTLGRYLAFVKRTSRIITEPQDIELTLAPHTPAIVALWHGQFLMSVRVRPKSFKLSIILARHGDAEVYAQAIAGEGVPLIRGAGAGGRQKDRGGAQAMRLALSALKDGYSFGMTADMPPGPARRSGDGIIMIAKHSGRPIIPLAVASRRYVSFNTWSRMTINLPFGTIAAVYGQPIYVPREADREQLGSYRAALERELDRVTRRAYALAGADPTRATPPGIEPEGSRGRLDRPGLLMRTYSVATALAQPFTPLLLGWRTSQGREDRSRRSERLGIASVARPPGTLVWVHAASVGETNAILPLIEAMRIQRPGLRFLLTTGTVTSAALASSRLGPDAVHQFVPLDTPRSVRMFLEHWRPDLAVFTESEIWPNLVWNCALRRIPLVLVNARMSDRSFQRWKNAGGFAREMFGRFDLVLAQNSELAARFTELGAPDVSASGNLKLDAPPPPVDPSSLEVLASAIAGRPSWLAASTHADEEIQVAAAHRRLSQRIPGLLTIIAPRHPERGTGIAEALKGLGLNVVLRSTGDLPTERTDIYIADTIGELGTFYALTPVAFIGGSLVPKGGQNPIEAIRHGAAVVMGPSWYNFSDACRGLLARGGMVEVSGEHELADTVARLLGDPREAEAIRLGAQVALLTLVGALDESVEALLGFLPHQEELRRAS